MSPKVLLSATLSLACLLYAATPASANLSLSYTTPNDKIIPGGNFVGAAITTSSGGPFDDINFNWYTGTVVNGQQVGSLTALAFGTVYIFTTVPTSLSPATLSTASGLVGSAAANSAGTAYVFDPSVTLQANTTYYFLNDTATSSPSNLNIYEHTSTSGGNLYVSASSSVNFALDPSDTLDFNLTGTDVINLTAVPEPTSLAMVGSGGVASLAFAWRLRRRKTTAA